MEPCTRRCTYLSPFLAVQGKHVDTMHLDTNKEHDPSARKGSTWESARKRISRPDSASIRYSLYDRVGRSAWAQKRSCTSCLPRLRAKTGRVIDTLPSTAWRGTLCTLSSSLVAPKARSSTSSTGVSRLRQQVRLQFFPTAPSPFAAATSPAWHVAPALSALAPHIHPEVGVGSWLPLAVVRMAHRCRLQLR